MDPKDPKADKPQDSSNAEAGDQGQGGDDTMAKCAGCETEQSSGHKHCVECGEPLAKASQAELDAALGELGEFHKSKTALAETLEVAPGEHPETDNLFAKSANGAEEVDPIAEALVRGHNVQADHITAVGTDTRATRRELGELAGLFAKCLTAMAEGIRGNEERVLGEIKGLSDRFQNWLDQPNKPRSATSATVTNFAKSVAGANGTGEDDSPSGDPLWKAAVALEGRGALQGGDATMTQQYANAGLSLHEITEANPLLGHRLTNALAAAGAGNGQ